MCTYAYVLGVTQERGVVRKNLKFKMTSFIVFWSDKGGGGLKVRFLECVIVVWPLILQIP